MAIKKKQKNLENPFFKEVGRRIDLFLKEKKITRDKFGKECGKTGTTVKSYCDGDSTPDSEFLALASRKFCLNPMWVLAGHGPMVNEFDSEPCNTLMESSPTDYEKECLRLKHEAADAILAAAELRNKLGMQQDKILESVRVTCRRAGLTIDQAHQMQQAVWDYEAILDNKIDDNELHHPAAGNGE